MHKQKYTMNKIIKDEGQQHQKNQGSFLLLQKTIAESTYPLEQQYCYKI